MEDFNMLQSIDCDVIKKNKPSGRTSAIAHTKEGPIYKIVMCGGSNRGQTTFIKKFTTGEFVRTNPTIGVDFALKKLTRNGRDITLQLWDIAGQEMTQQMSRMYYQGANACVIMFDMTYPQSLEICHRWKRDLDSKCTLSNGDPIPCILLANKSDLIDDRKFTPQQIQQFSQENGYLCSMETSVKLNKNVNESMEYLVDHLLQQDSPIQQLPNASIKPTENNPPKSKCTC